MHPDSAPCPPSEWLWFVAARFPNQGYERAGWHAYIKEHGLDDTCLDTGHEFWCRFGEGACRRKGPLTCNDDEAWMVTT